VVLKGAFTLQEVQAAEDPDEFYEELQNEVAQECEAKAGNLCVLCLACVLYLVL